ncbi:MAG: hypothetical protein IKJ82_01365 [Oscillospiraceae bacterium]|nr:hypothetical protein [Oscillospiraceae bacterium]
MMKRIFVFVLAFVLIFSLCSCGKNTPPEDISKIEITYYENFEEYEQREGKTVSLGDEKGEILSSIAKHMIETGKSTSKPMNVPRFDIKFESEGKSHFIYIDYENTFAASFLDGGNYFCLTGNDYYSDIKKLFAEAE